MKAALEFKKLNLCCRNLHLKLAKVNLRSSSRMKIKEQTEWQENSHAYIPEYERVKYKNTTTEINMLRNKSIQLITTEYRKWQSKKVRQK